MAFLDELLISRRSIRRYKALPVPENSLQQILSAAVLIPSSGNTQPVRLIRIASPAILSRLQAAMAAGRQHFLEQAKQCDRPKKLRNWINAYYRFSTFMFHAPLLLALGTVPVQAGLSRTLAETGLSLPKGRWETDADIAVGLALQGIMLKAQEMGFGTCILTAPLAFIADVEEILGVTDLKIKCFLILGVPDEAPKGPPKKELSQLYRTL